MQKIQELVKEGKLAKNLMVDKEFVDGAKEIFKSEKIEMDDEKLKQLMNQIEANLKKSNILDDKALEEVSGGITAKGIGAGIVKTVTTTTGAVVATALGGLIAGGTVWIPIMKVADDCNDDFIAPTLAIFVAPAVTGVAGIAGAGISLIPGGILGKKLGDWICKKTGLES